MKKTLLILLLNIPLLCMAQTKKPINGFFGITFGADSATVKSIVLAKGGLVNAGATKPGHMVFSNVNYKTWKNASLYVEILDNKAYKISLAIMKAAPGNVLEDYKKIVNETTAAYGAGTNGSEQNASLTLWVDKDKNNISATTLSPEILILSYKDNDLGPIGQRLH